MAGINLEDITPKPGEPMGRSGGCLCNARYESCYICDPKNRKRGDEKQFTLADLQKAAEYFGSPEYESERIKKEVEVAAFYAPGGPFEQNGFKYPPLVTIDDEPESYSGPFKPAGDCMKSARAAGGDGWDGVADVDAEISSIRGRDWPDASGIAKAARNLIDSRIQELVFGQHPDRIQVGKLDDGSPVYLGDRLDWEEYKQKSGETWIATVGGMNQIEIVDGIAQRCGWRSGFDGLVRWEASDG